MSPRAPDAPTISPADAGGGDVAVGATSTASGRPTVRRLVTAKFTADYLGVTTRTLRTWTAAGLLGYVKVGRTLRFDLRHLEKFVNRHAVGGAP